jgi:transcriptional regulator NrdR family protein
MLCPICGVATKTLERRFIKEMNGVTTRKRKCPECLTIFSTSEKVLFTSLPPYVRERFLSNGKRQK